MHVLDRRVGHRDVYPRRIQDEAVHLAFARVAALHGEGQRQAAARRVAEDDNAAELSLGLVDDGLDEVERFCRGVFGGERVVRNDDGQARAVDEALDDAPLAVNQREEVGTAVQEDEGATRAQALLREHAGHALVARRRETRSHRRRHGVLLRGTRRHVARGFLGVQRGRRKALSGVNETHLEGHGASFVSTNHSARTGTHPRANRYQDTLCLPVLTHRGGSSPLPQECKSGTRRGTSPVPAGAQVQCLPRRSRSFVVPRSSTGAALSPGRMLLR